MFGNQWELEEVEGSVARRVLMFLFSKRLNQNDIDALLFARITMDIGPLILKWMYAYQYFIDRIKNLGLWSEHGVPEYFHYTKELIEIRNNVLLSFLQEGFGPKGEFIFHAQAYMTEGDFLDAGHQYAKRKGLTFPEWKQEVYQSQFEDFGLTYAPKGRMMDSHGNLLTDDRYIRGIGYKSEFSDLNVDDTNSSARNARRRTQTQVPRGQEAPTIQSLREVMSQIKQKGFEIPMDLIEQMRVLFN